MNIKPFMKRPGELDQSTQGKTLIVGMGKLRVMKPDARDLVVALCRKTMKVSPLGEFSDRTVSEIVWQLGKIRVYNGAKLRKK